MAAKQKRGTGSVRRLPSKRWQARITGPDLQRHTAPKTFGTKQAAEAWIAQEARLMENADAWQPPRERLLSQADQRARAEAARITFSEYADQFLEARVVRDQPLQPSTKKRYTELLTKYLNPTFGDVALEQITPNMVATWWAALPPSRKIRKEAYTLARAIMREATGVHGPIAGHPIPFQIRGAGTGASPKRETTVSRDELKVILDTIRPEWRLMVQLALWCGMRAGELVELRWSDIDLDAGVIHIRRALGMAGSAAKHVKAPKSEAGSRDQRIPAALIPMLRAHQAQQLSGAMTGRDTLVFPSRTGGHLNPSVFYGKPKSSPDGPKPPVPGGWFAAREAAGRPDLRFHDLRATGATLLAQSGATLAEVQLFLGDSTPAAALRYVRATSVRMNELTDRLSALAEGGSW